MLEKILTEEQELEKDYEEKNGENLPYAVVDALAQMMSGKVFGPSRLSTLGDRLKSRNVKTRAMHRAILESQEREREAIANDLREETVQKLATALLQLEMALGEDGLQPEKRNYIESASNSIDLALKQLLDLSTSLYPSVLEALGLLEALRNLVRRMNACHTIDFRLVAKGEEGELPEEVKINLYRLVEEALSEVIDHPGVSKALIYFNRDSDGIDLMVSRDGEAHPNRSAHDWNNLGLVGMRERAAQIGGTFDCRPGSQEARVEVHIKGADLKSR